jgi:WD40 repeat protein
VSNDADGIIALTVVPNTERVVAIEWDTGIVIWDLADLAFSRMGVALAWGRAQYGGLDRVTTDGRLLVSFNARRVELFELLTGIQVLVVEAENYGIVSVCLSPDGCRLVCADERRVRVWHLESRAEEAVFYSDTEITAVACASDELFIVGTVGGHVHQLQLRDGPSPPL